MGGGGRKDTEGRGAADCPEKRKKAEMSEDGGANMCLGEIAVTSEGTEEQGPQRRHPVDLTGPTGPTGPTGAVVGSFFIFTFSSFFLKVEATETNHLMPKVVSSASSSSSHRNALLHFQLGLTDDLHPSSSSQDVTDST